MGQTLTHGVYLPDEGERNCYNGLAANWQLLDNSVGTIAEHTTALAGKAPAVHTHTKSQITDFPAYGNTAGTICEGNDSRLSDARTPLSHTHTKSNVTDLLNSNFIPSANNTYDLGSSSYQWNNVYSKNYFYNGVAWGLDKSNVWSQNQTITSNSASLTLKNPLMTQGVAPSSNRFSSVVFQDVNNTELGFVSFKKHKNSNNYLILNVKNTNGTDIFGNNISFAMYPTGHTSFYPDSFDCDLGTSTNKWATLNGINPGALSLPVTALNNTYDISGNITDLTGGNNSITAARTGWIFVKSDNATEISIENTTTGMGASDHSASAATLMVSVPVTSGESVNIIANCTSIDKAYLLPCQGNV